MTSILEILTSEVSQRLGWSLLHFVWEGLAIGLIAWLGLLALRRRDSESRYRFLVLSFAALALAPVVTLFVVDPVAATSKEVEVASPTIASVPAVVVDAREALPPLPDIISGEVAPKEVQTPPPKTDVSVTQSNLQSTPEPSGLQPVVDAPKPSVIPINWTTHLSRSLPWCVAIWLGGVGLLVVRLIFQWGQLRRMATQYVRPLESRWQVLTSHMLDAFEIGRAVKFMESQLADVPCVIGWLKPVVLVPTAVMTNLTPTEVEALLIHELVHIKRRDDVINLAQTVVETLLFYHPVVWWISAQIRAERENCCDDVASALIGDRLAYSRALVAAAEVATRTRPPKVALAATGGELTSRIRRLLGLDGNSPPQIHWTAPLIAVVTLALMTGLIACAPAVDKDNATTKAKDTPVESFVESDELLTSIRGVLRDINGKPLSGVRILLHESPVVYPSPNPGETFDIAQTVTNTDGRFEFKSIPIQADVYWADRTRMFDVIALPDAKSGLAMAWQSVPDKSDVTLTLKQGKTIAGTVTNLDGEPVAGATLQLRHLMSVRHITQADLEDGRWPRMDDPKYLSLQNSEHAPLVTSDNKGTFRLTNLPENAGLMLDVLHDEHVPALAYAATVKELDAISQQRLKRPVQAGKLDVQLDPGHDVTVKVVYGDSGELVKGAQRYLGPVGKRNQQSFRNWVNRIEESQDGTFHLKAVKSGEFRFSAQGPPDDSFPPKFELGILSTELRPDKRKHEFTVMLPVSNLVPLTVSVVREDSAEPVVGADIIYREVSITPGSFTAFRSEQNGSQTVLVRPGTTYRFFVRDAGRGRMRTQEFTPEEKTPGELTFKVTPDPVYRGVAVDVEGQPVSGVSIYYRVRVGEHGIRSQRATTNENGEFELKGLFAEIFFEHDQPIDEPTSTLFYHADTGTGAIVDLPLPNGEQPESITVQLKKTEVVTGQLLEADSGMPVAGAKVQLTRLNQAPRAGFFQPIGEPIETDESGMFHVQGGFVGESHDLFITKENFTLKSRADFEIKEPGEFDLGMMELEPTKPRPPVWQVKVPDVSSMERDVALTTLMRAFEASENEFKGKKVNDGETKFRTPGDGVWQFSRHIWPLVEEDPTSEPSFAASLWLIKHWGFAYAHDKRHGEIRRQAAKLVYEHFIERPELADVATSIIQAGFAKSTGRNMTPLEMGEILVAKNSHPAVRAAALYEVARWLLDTEGGSRTVMSQHKAAAAPLLQSVIDDFPNEEIYEGETYANRCREMLAEFDVQSPNDAEAATAFQEQDQIEWTPKQLLDGMNSSMAQYKTIDIRYEVREQRNTNAFGKGDEIIVEGNSSYLFRTDGDRWKADEKSFTYRSGTTELRPTAQTIGFDGISHYALERGELVLGQETSGDRRHHPATLFWRIGRLRSWLTKALEVPEARVIAYEEVDGHRCVRVESQWAFNENGAVVKFNLLVSPHQGFLPIQAVIDVDGKDGTHWQLSGLTQDQDSGLWYPTGIHETHDLALPVKRKLYIVTHFSAKPHFTEDDFQIKHPGAVDIVDYRSGDVYFNDVWYPELKKFMREKFNQPPLWLEPTDHLISYADVAVNGKPAPELQAATWLPADPGRWKREGRKWTVLHFFGGGLYQPTPEQICGLKAFRDKYKELGVDVIGVVPHDQVDNAKRTIDTLQIDFPVAVSAPSDAKGYGQIYADFQLKTYGGTFLVDPEGIIHFINNQEAGGDSALTLEQALIKRMGLDKDAYKRQETGFVIEDWRAILREWRRLRNSTPAALTLRGSVVSANKEAGDYGGVTIVAVPHLSVVHGHITAGHTVQDDNQDGVTVTCNPDGTFSIPGLRKATYKLKISGPGISSTERFANVQEGEVGEEFEIRLE